MKQLIKEVLLTIVVVTVFMATLFMAFLQQSYRLNPPSAAERAAHPILVKFLYGGE